MANRPIPFPKNDETWKDVYRLEKKGCDYYPYRNEDGDILWVVYVDRTFKNKKGKKAVQQGSYNGTRYVFENLWTKLEGFTKPLYRLDELLKTTLPIAVAEGEKCADIGQKLFPEYFWTTWQGGRSNGLDNDWSVVKGKDITFVSDVDHDGKGKKEFTKLARKLNKKLELNAKLVNLPTFTEIMKWYKDANEKDYPKDSWDNADDWFAQYTHEDFREGMRRAEVPVPVGEFQDIETDVQEGKYIFIASSGRLYYDKEKDIYSKDIEINQLYKRDSELSGLATTYFHTKGIEYVDRQTFRPGKPLIINEGKSKILNKYKAPTFDEPKKVKDISWFRNHLKLLANDDPKILQTLEDIIAFDIQKPEENRTFAVVFYSGQGTGKTMLFNVLKKLYGKSNCSDLHLDQLVGKYQPFMLSSCYLFINEIDSTGKDIKSKQAMLRSLISDTNFMVEMKNVDLIPISNCHYTIWGATNEPYPLYIPGDDRRIMFCDIGISRYEILNSNPDYFKNFLAKSRDSKNIESLFHHYKNVHKISKEFNPNEAPKTLAKEELIEASKPQYMNTLDKLFEQKAIKSFQRDIMNSRVANEELKELEDYSVRAENFTENKIMRWIRFDPNNFRILKGEPYQIKGSVRGRCWVVRNHEYWNQYKTNKEVIDMHFEKKLETPEFNFGANVKKEAF